MFRDNAHTFLIFGLFRFRLDFLPSLGLICFFCIFRPNPFKFKFGFRNFRARRAIPGLFRFISLMKENKALAIYIDNYMPRVAIKRISRKFFR